MRAGARAGRERVGIELVYAPIPARALDADIAVLSAAEQSRASAMTHAGARASTVTARALLRRELGRVLGVPPQDVPLTAASGAPRLPDDRLHVSIAHAGGLAVVGWTHLGRLGVDLEPLDRDVDRDRLAPRVFAVTELADADAMAPRPFLERWTRKEAWLKAVRVGLGVPLRALTVTTGPDPRVTAVPDGVDDATPAARWRLGTFDVDDGWIGAWCLDIGAGAPPTDVRIRAAAG